MRDPSQPLTTIQMGVGVPRVPTEVFVRILELACLHVRHLAGLMLIRWDWRVAIPRAPTLWTHLDVAYATDRAGRILTMLIPRSGIRPLTIICRCTHEFGASEVCAVLKVHLYRVRTLAIRSGMHEAYAPVLGDLLRAPAPLLRSLELSTGTAAPALSRFRTPGPTSILIPPDLSGSLRDVDCGSHVLPATTCRAFANVIWLHMTIGQFNRDSLQRVFQLFPRLISLFVDNCDYALGLGVIAFDHSLREVRLACPLNWVGNTISWPALVAAGYTRRPQLCLQHFNVALACAAAADRSWTPRSLVLDGSLATVAFVPTDCALTRELTLALSLVRAVPLLAPALKVMDRIVELTLSIALPFFTMLVPRLTVLTILCGDTPSRRLLGGDPSARQQRALTAPKLGEIRFKAAANATPTVLPPLEIAWFISTQIQIDGKKLHELKIDTPLVSLAEDAAGLAALENVVSKVEMNL